MTIDANFNSIKVQLKQQRRVVKQNSLNNFNSIKVQLKHTPVFIIEVWQEFQFHKGTIKTVTISQ